MATPTAIMEVGWDGAHGACPDHVNCPDHGECYPVVIRLYSIDKMLLSHDVHHIWGSLSSDAADVMRDHLICQTLDANRVFFDIESSVDEAMRPHQ